MEKHTKDVIIFGMQGAGKGTQGSLLAKEKNLVIFETGGALRKIRQENSELGRIVKDIMDKGDLVTNEIVMDIIEDFLQKNKGNRILFDGIPRMIEQKKTFDALIKKSGRTLEGVFLTIPEEEAISRMLERGRADDTLEVIKNRLKNYNQETLPVIEEYEEEGIITRIEGVGSIEEISTEVIRAVS